MGLLDDAINRAQELAAQVAPREPATLPYNPTLAARNAPPGEPQTREPIKRSTVADANGVATITLDAVEPGATWLLDYVVITSTSANQTLCSLFEGDPSNANLLDGTGKGNRGVAWYQPPRRLASTQALNVQWTGATPGAKCTLRVEYRVEAAP